jgi:hypothetical protein
MESHLLIARALKAHRDESSRLAAHVAAAHWAPAGEQQIWPAEDLRARVRTPPRHPSGGPLHLQVTASVLVAEMSDAMHSLCCLVLRQHGNEVWIAVLLGATT